MLAHTTPRKPLGAPLFRPKFRVISEILVARILARRAAVPSTGRPHAVRPSRRDRARDSGATQTRHVAAVPHPEHHGEGGHGVGRLKWRRPLPFALSCEKNDTEARKLGLGVSSSSARRAVSISRRYSGGWVGKARALGAKEELILSLLESEADFGGQ